jgi:hypothetical protein
LLVGKVVSGVPEISRLLPETKNLSPGGSDGTLDTAEDRAKGAIKWIVGIGSFL